MNIVTAGLRFIRGLVRGYQMMQENRRRKHEFNIGDYLHIFEVAVLVGSMGAAWSTVQQAVTQVKEHTQQLERIEHYLSSRDPEYWQRTSSEGR